MGIYDAEVGLTLARRWFRLLQIFTNFLLVCLVPLIYGFPPVAESCFIDDR